MPILEPRKRRKQTDQLAIEHFATLVRLDGIVYGCKGMAAREVDATVPLKSRRQKRLCVARAWRPER